MTISQQRFLNATVIGFTESIGWGETPSQLVVTLVNDPDVGDNFQPGNVGRPCTFQFGGHTFTGILQSHKEVVDTGGFTFEAVIVDPREFLNNVPIILDGYTGPVYTPNLLNVYGYLESFGFGSSQKNETGIPWTLIARTIQGLTQLPQQGDFGGPLYFISSRYIVDLTGLPQVPEDYRVGGDEISLLQFISEIADAGGCNYFISMTETTPGIFVIKVNCQSRTVQINYGAVTQFLDSIPEFESKSAGSELANENMSKFLVGGKVRELWYQYGDYSLGTVWPFWGYDANGNPIIGTGLGNSHTFTLDSRAVNNPRVGPTYTTDVAEMRAVLGGRASWETFLTLNSQTGTIHSGKASVLGIVGYIANTSGVDLIAKLINDFKASDEDDKKKKVKKNPNQLFYPHTPDNLIDYEQLDIETGYLYEFLYQVANQYYGRMFMVNIPYTSAAIEPDTLKIRVSQFPVESAFLSEELWPEALQKNLIPLDIEQFSEEDGKIVCYVRFDNGDLLNLSEISPTSIGYNSRNPGYGKHKLDRYAIFVKGTVEERVTFLDFETQFGPRAIITLDGPVFERIAENDYSSQKLLVDFINGGFSGEGIDINSDEYKKNVLDPIINSLGQDVLNFGQSPKAVIPNMAVIPLESQTTNYGPWYANGIPGGVEYEVDETLVPWNYAGFDAMNLVANSKVSEVIGSNYQLENGEVTFPDAPYHNLGQQLAIGGPLVTDISVNIGTGGYHTTYRFERNIKVPRYGFAKAERVAQLARTAQRLRKAVRVASQPKRVPDTKLTAKPILITNAAKQEHPKKKKTSSHEMIVGQVYTDSDGNTSISTYIQPNYNFIQHAKYFYEDKGYTSLKKRFILFVFELKSYPKNIH